MPGSICYKGQKQAFDYCDYGFECLSRCCHNQKCSNVIQCVATCAVNSQCDNKCCSFGYCAGSFTTCTMGQKEDFDHCESDNECKSKLCLNSRCESEVGPVRSSMTVIAISIVFVMVVIIAVTGCCLSSKRFFSGNGGDYTDASSHYHQNGHRHDTSER